MIDENYVRISNETLLELLKDFKPSAALYHLQMMKMFTSVNVSPSYIESLNRMIAVFEERAMNEILLGDEDGSTYE